MTKQTKIIVATIVFLLVAIADVYAVVAQNKSLEMVFKPLLMTTLAVVYLVSVKKSSFWLLSALFFSFWGDVFLLDKANFFVFGLASFLVAHFIYIKIVCDFLRKQKTSKTLVAMLPFTVFFLGLINLIYKNLGDMLLPVLVYGITISVLGVLAFLNYLQEKSTANSWLLLGVVLFIASDSLIAINKFYVANNIFAIAIMVLYILAQYLIVKAIIAKQLD